MKRILLVDDQAHVLRVIKLSLDRQGFEVDTALSGDIAVAMLKSGAGRACQYDVLIVDADMPGMNGMQLCEAVQRDLHAFLPLMFVAARSNDYPVSEWAKRFKFAECIAKPMSLQQLIPRLESHTDFVNEDRLSRAIG